MGKLGSMTFVAAAIWLWYALVVPAAPTRTIVFIGDSITLAGPWSKLCPGAVVLARGSASTRDLLAFLPAAVAAKPDAVVIMAGVNDIALDVPEDETVENLNRMAAAFSGARVILHAILPVTEAYPRPGYNARIAAINARLPADRVVVSVALRDYMGDGIHLRPNAYRAWASRLRDVGACR